MKIKKTRKKGRILRPSLLPLFLPRSLNSEFSLFSLFPLSQRCFDFQADKETLLSFPFILIPFDSIPYFFPCKAFMLISIYL